MAKDPEAKKNKKSGGKGGVIQVDGAKMQGGGGSVRIPEDDYPAKVAKIERGKVKDGDNAGTTMLIVHYKIAKGKHKGKVIKDRIVLMESTLWKLRQLMEALGKKVPSKVFKVDVDKFVGGDVVISVVDGEPYKNRIKSEISDVQNPDNVDTDEDDDDDDDNDSDDDELEDVDLDDEL
jgi:hypothetical protein